MKIIAKTSLAIIASGLFFSILAVTEARGQVLNEILKRMDAHQKSLSTLRSKIRMEKFNSQLKEKDITEGTALYMRSAERQITARIDWTKPAQESLAVRNNQFIIYRPRLNQAILGKIEESKGTAKVYNALSFLNMSKSEIKAFYKIQYLGEEKVKETQMWYLVFTPKKPTLYKSADFWVNGDGMPIQAKVLENNDDTTTVLLSDFKKNEAIAINNFEINIPRGTVFIVDSIGVCPCFKPFDAADALKNYSDAVFSGKVTAIDGTNYTFKTERTWKDAVGTEQIVRSAYTEASCAPKLTMGERYAVFARKINVNGKSILDLKPCNFTANLAGSSGAEILKALGKGKRVKKAFVRKKRRSK